MTTYDYIEITLKSLPRHLNVTFALYCCDDIKDLIKDKASIKAIELTRQWLKDENSVSQAELEAAGDAAAYYTARAAHAAATAAHVANDHDNKILQYKNHLDKMISSLTRLERLI